MYVPAGIDACDPGSGGARFGDITRQPLVNLCRTLRIAFGKLQTEVDAVSKIVGRRDLDTESPPIESPCTLEEEVHCVPGLFVAEVVLTWIVAASRVHQVIEAHARYTLALEKVEDRFKIAIVALR